MFDSRPPQGPMNPIPDQLCVFCKMLFGVYTMATTFKLMMTTHHLDPNLDSPPPQGPMNTIRDHLCVFSAPVRVLQMLFSVYTVTIPNDNL